MRSSSALLLGLLAASACSHGEVGPLPGEDYPGGFPVDGGVRPPDDGGTPATDAGMIYSGRYQLVSIVDLAGANAFGDTISTTLVELSQFHDHPAATILDLMALYDVPYFAPVWDILPDFLKDPVTDLLDELIVDTLFDDIPAVDRAAEIITDVGTASRNVELSTEMTLVGPAAGTALLRGQHVLTGLGFHLWGAHAEIPVPDVFQQITQLE